MPAKGDPVRWLSTVLKPGDVFIDGGANIGRMSEAALKLGARVFAVEPDPRCVDALTTLGVTHIACALGAGTGAGPFFLAQGSAHSSRFAACGDFEQETVVPLVALDSLDDATAIKLDLQGGEADAILGADRQLSVCRQWCVELWPHGFRQAHGDPQVFLDAFASHGLIPHWFDDGYPETTYGEVLAYLNGPHEGHEHINVIFSR